MALLEPQGSVEEQRTFGRLDALSWPLQEKLSDAVKLLRPVVSGRPSLCHVSMCASKVTYHPGKILVESTGDTVVLSKTVAMWGKPESCEPAPTCSHSRPEYVLVEESLSSRPSRRTYRLRHAAQSDHMQTARSAGK